MAKRRYMTCVSYATEAAAPYLIIIIMAHEKIERALFWVMVFSASLSFAPHALLRRCIVCCVCFSKIAPDVCGVCASSM